MEGESPAQASTPSGAVFLSYASEDVEAARRICEALRAAGIEVWLDQSELRGGDAWDRQIRERIHSCRLFIALISNHTQARDEGYFRREWKLAVDRTHDMLEQKAFLLPVVIDATPERGAAVPDKFHEVQWTHLPGGETPPQFVARVARLLLPEPILATPVRPTSGAAPTALTPGRPSRLRRSLPIAIAVLLGGALAYLLADKLRSPKHGATAPPATSTELTPSPPVTTPTTGAFAPPPHSIAVLPFVNLSADKEQEYFSDGLTEEILNSLTRINELQVAARTSAFSFKGKDIKIGTIARELNVGAILEGSVRRSGNTVRITAQLNNALTGFHLWSKTYDRDLSHVLQLQTEIANAVASALEVTLLGDVVAKIEVGGTRNPAAFDAYLRGSNASLTVHNLGEAQAAVAAYTEAIRLDPRYAQAFAARSLAQGGIELFATTVAAVRETLDAQQADAREALRLAPDLVEGHLALARYYADSLNFAPADEELRHALALAPGDARVLSVYGGWAVHMGRFDAGIAALRHAVVLDPLSPIQHRALGSGLALARRHSEAIAAFEHALALDPDSPQINAQRGLSYYALGDFHRAQTSCERWPEFFENQVCLAITYEKLGRHADAEASLAKLKASWGDTAVYLCAEIYAQWGDQAKALQWLDTAMRLHDGFLEVLKIDYLLDPLRGEPRFQAIERELNFPD